MQIGNFVKTSFVPPSPTTGKVNLMVTEKYSEIIDTILRKLWHLIRLHMQKTQTFPIHSVIPSRPYRAKMSEVPVSATRRRSRSRSKGRSGSEAKPIRVWCPGSFDMLHFGHVSFLRKVKADMQKQFSNIEIVVGLYTDKDSAAMGQPTVFTMDERYEMLRANKWVDQIVPSAPLEISRNVLKEHNCDYAYCSAQDGPQLGSPKFDEKFIHHELREFGLLKIISMSKYDYASGASTSQLVNRMMLLENRDANNNTISGRDWAPRRQTFPDSISCDELIRFATVNVPKKTDKIVYIDGPFDLLHPGHLLLLEKARALGDFLYVGLHSDEAISKYAGNNFPLMAWNERLMALLSCKYVSEVVIDAPVGVDNTIIDTFSVSVVVPGINDYQRSISGQDTTLETIDKYKAAKQRGIYRDFENPAIGSVGNITLADVLYRVHQKWTEYSYILNKIHADMEAGLTEVNLSRNRDDGDVLKFSSNNTLYTGKNEDDDQ